MEAAQLAEDLRAQGEHVQARLRELQACAAENRAAKDKESLSLKRAQVGTPYGIHRGPYGALMGLGGAVGGPMGLFGEAGGCLRHPMGSVGELGGNIWGCGMGGGSLGSSVTCCGVVWGRGGL